MKKLFTILAMLFAGSAVFAGASNGPLIANERVEAETTDVYEISFDGGEDAEIIVDGDGDTDLDLYVYDEYGNLITEDDDYTDYCICTWIPKWSGKFTIRIVNLGNVYNEYTLTTN